MVSFSSEAIVIAIHAYMDLSTEVESDGAFPPPVPVDEAAGKDSKMLVWGQCTDIRGTPECKLIATIVLIALFKLHELVVATIILLLLVSAASIIAKT